MKETIKCSDLFAGASCFSFIDAWKAYFDLAGIEYEEQPALSAVVIDDAIHPLFYLVNVADRDKANGTWAYCFEKEPPDAIFNVMHHLVFQTEKPGIFLIGSTPQAYGYRPRIGYFGSHHGHIDFNIKSRGNGSHQIFEVVEDDCISFAKCDECGIIKLVKQAERPICECGAVMHSGCNYRGALSVSDWVIAHRAEMKEAHSQINEPIYSKTE